jgi:hypothetical protein
MPEEFSCANPEAALDEFLEKYPLRLFWLIRQTAAELTVEYVSPWIEPTGH